MTYQMDLRDLCYFEAIAEKGHLGRAAKQLCLSQPALTGCIHRLEEAFGTPLFERVGRGIRLTPAAPYFWIRFSPAFLLFFCALCVPARPATSPASPDGR